MLLTMAATAHHSRMEFSRSEIREIEGEVVSVFWRNPHVHVRVRTEDGALWDLEGADIVTLDSRPVLPSGRGPGLGIPVSSRRCRARLGRGPVPTTDSIGRRLARRPRRVSPRRRREPDPGQRERGHFMVHTRPIKLSNAPRGRNEMKRDNLLSSGTSPRTSARPTCSCEAWRWVGTWRGRWATIPASS